MNIWLINWPNPPTAFSRPPAPVLLQPSRRKYRSPSKGAGGAVGSKSNSYLDRDWTFTPPAFFPDKWYIRVAWACVLTAAAVYLNIAAVKG